MLSTTICSGISNSISQYSNCALTFFKLICTTEPSEASGLRGPHFTKREAEVPRLLLPRKAAALHPDLLEHSLLAQVLDPHVYRYWTVLALPFEDLLHAGPCPKPVTSPNSILLFATAPGAGYYY